MNRKTVFVAVVALAVVKLAGCGGPGPGVEDDGPETPAGTETSGGLFDDAEDTDGLGEGNGTDAGVGDGTDEGLGDGTNASGGDGIASG